MIKDKLRILRAATVALVGLLSFFAGSTAFAADQKKSFDIPGGDALPALKQFSAQSGEQLLYSAEAVTGTTIRSVKGSFTPREALDRMVQGTDLRVMVDRQNGALSLVRDKSPNAQRVAQETATTPKDQSKVEDGVLKLDTFEVMGTKSLNMDVPRSRDDAQPYVVFGRSDIEKQGALNVEDFLRARLPMNTQVGSNSQLPGAGLGNSSGINLRGLGTNQTLILVDGRRLPSIGTGSSVSQPDINGLPLSSVERIEILPATAGGIYGGGATGGVINIITRRGYAGVELRATYGNTFRSDASTTRVDLSAGMALRNGRTNVLLNASHTSSTPLMVGERDFGFRARQLLLKNNPNAFYNLATPVVGYTPNIRSVNGSNLVLTNGTALNSPRTFVPVGYSGVSSDGGAALVTNAGNYNLNPGEDASNARRSLLWAPEVDSYTFSVRHQFSSMVEGYIDLSYTKNKSSAIGATGITTSATLPVGAPNNPFTTSIRVAYPITNLELPIYSTTQAQGLIAGLIVKLPHSWKAVGEVNRNKSTYRGLSNNPALTTAGSTAISSGSVDVVRDLNRFPISWSSIADFPPSTQGPMNVAFEQASLRASGPLAEFSGKTLTLNASVESRKETSDEAFSEFNTATAKFITLYPERSQRVDAGFLEARMPIIDKNAGIPLVRSLEIAASARYEKYNTRAPNPTNGSLSAYSDPRPVFTYAKNEVKQASYTVAARHDIADGFAFRASVGTGFLPPSISQLVQSFNPTFSGFGNDPKREKVSAFWTTPVALTQGGSPSLKPEHSTSISLGTVISPTWLNGLRLSADYTRIKKTDEIKGFTLQQALDFEDYLPGRITRAALTPSDIALGYTGGAITAMNISLSNIANTLVEAFDFQADYSRNVGPGKMSVYALATLQTHTKRRVAATAPVVDSVGYSSGELRWRGNLGLDYAFRDWTFGWNAQYYNSYIAYAGGSSASVVASAILNQGTDTIPAQWYHDVYAKYRFPGGFAKILNGTEVNIGIQNLFDRYPPVLASTAANLGYSQFGDPRLRRYTISVRKSF